MPWIRTPDFVLVNMDNVERVQKAKEGHQFFARAYYDHQRYITLRFFDTEEECDQYLARLAEVFFEKDFPEQRVTQLFKDRWLGREK